MAITKYPLIDAFETTLSQEWDWNTWTIYVNSVPEFTFPWWVTTYIVVDADNSKIQVAEINAISTWAKTMTVNSVSVAKWNWVAYTSQVHSIGAKVRISDNYIFWKTIIEAVNWIETSTVQTNVNGTTIWTYADATARDAAITSPVNGKYQAYLASEWYWTDYVWGSWQQRATGVTPNASTTVSGKVELATDAEVTAWTATWWTGASLVATPDQIKKSISLKGSVSTSSDSHEFVMNQSGEDKRITQLLLRDQIVASTTQKWFVEMATNAEAYTATDETRYVNPKQLIYWWPAPTAGTDLLVGTISSERMTTSATYTQKFISAPILRTWTYTVSFTLSWINWWSWWQAYGRIYKNWSPFWTEQTTTSAYPSFVTKTENLSFTSWDTIELWIHSYGVGWDQTYTNNLNVSCNQTHFTIS